MRRRSLPPFVYFSSLLLYGPLIQDRNNRPEMGYLLYDNTIEPYSSPQNCHTHYHDHKATPTLSWSQLPHPLSWSQSYTHTIMITTATPNIMITKPHPLSWLQSHIHYHDPNPHPHYHDHKATPTLSWPQSHTHYHDHKSTTTIMITKPCPLSWSQLS